MAIDKISLTPDEPVSRELAAVGESTGWLIVSALFFGLLLGVYFLASMTRAEPAHAGTPRHTAMHKAPAPATTTGAASAKV